MGEKSVSYVLDKELITRIYRELKKLITQRINNAMDNGQMN
jgi:GTP:adenosylcobinamide-phosphate guanylyltransferase